MLAENAHQGRSWRRASKGYHFCLTRDFPTHWFDDQYSLPKKKDEAKKWLESVCRHFALDGRRVSGGDAAVVMMEKFWLTKNAAEEVFKNADITNRGRSGRIKDNESVNINEIKDLNLLG